MAVAYRISREIPDPVAAVAVAVPSDRIGDEALSVDWDFLRRVGFEGKLGQVSSLRVGKGPVVLVFGTGPTADLSPVVVRRASGYLGRLIHPFESVAVVLLEVLADKAAADRSAQALVEGLTLGGYKFERYKSKSEASALRRVHLLGEPSRSMNAALKRGQVVAEAVCLARNLVNTPGGELTPIEFVRQARAALRGSGVTVDALGDERIAREGLGGLVAVNKGSHEPARYMRLTYTPDSAERSVALVGKGITFDSGGLSLKTAEGMKTMKDDMAGAAAVVAATSALAKLGVKHEVRCYIPLTDNMPSGSAQRVGDILTTRSGKTVEVLNTDAEGRLVLADALDDACSRKPDAVVDIATLTGACMVALGSKVAGIMGNNERWIGEVLEAATRAGERAWWLPLPREYRRDLDSDVADLKNIGGPHGGALTAGLFLQEFVGTSNWAHVDIAGPAWSNEAEAEITRGGTGFGVRLLLELLMSGAIPERAPEPATKQAATKQAATKQAATKQAAPKKPANKKPANKTPASKTPASKKAPGNKAAPKKPASKKAPGNKAPSKKRPPMKRGSSRAAARPR